MVVIFGPPPTISNFTVAVVLMRFAGWPAFSRLADSAIEKQPASAAAISSSGLVPFPSSKRDEKEYGPSNAPLPSFIVPLPCLSVPSQTADPVLVAIVLSPLVAVSVTIRAGRARVQFAFRSSPRTVILSGALQRNAKHEARLSKISDCRSTGNCRTKRSEIEARRPELLRVVAASLRSE